MKQNYKNIVIGFGRAGRTLAQNLAQRGETVLLVEKDKEMYGGTCPNVGCAPSKALIGMAHKNIPFEKAIAEKRKLVLTLRGFATAMLTSFDNISIVNGTASFIANKEIEVTQPSGEKTQFSAERIFINTGSTPIIPSIAGVQESANIITSKEAMDLDKLPEHLVIIGAGHIGLEFAAMYKRFGAQVTIIEKGNKFLPMEDYDVAEQIFNDIQIAGVQIIMNAQILQVKDNGTRSTVIFSKDNIQQELHADKILLSTGRKPNIAELGLENTNIELTAQGAIKVNETLQTTVENVFAMGDVCGGAQFFYLSGDDCSIVENYLFGNKTRNVNDRNPVPYTVFINPPLSRMGLSEKEAKAQNIDYRLFKYDAARIVKANVARNTRRVSKALVDKKTGEILGVTLYHKDSHEVINLISVVMKNKLPYTVLKNHVFTHPTMSEGLASLFSSEIVGE